MEARATFHNSDFKLTLGRVLCPSSVSFTALGLFTESDIKIAMILECLGGVWGQEERWGPGLFVWEDGRGCWSWWDGRAGQAGRARAASKIPGAGEDREGGYHP